MKRRTLKILRWTAIGTAIAAGALGLALLSAYAFLQSPSGRALVVEILNERMSTPGATQVRIGRLDGDLRSRIEIRDVTVGDGEGTWLHLDFAGASWRPVNLLTGRLSISKLDFEGLSVLRRPGHAEDSGEFHWPELPVRISVEHFSLDDARLEEPVLGQRVAFRATGDTAIEGPDSVTTTIGIARTDGVSGQARLEVLANPRSKFLRFRLALNEADGGVLARVLELEDLPSLSIQADGEGPLDALRGSARMRAGDLASVESEFTIDVSDGPALDLAGTARVERLVEPPIRTLLSGDVAFEVQGELTQDGFRLRRGRAANALLKMELSGELSGRAADLDVSMEVPDLAPLADIAGIALQGQASARSRIRSDDIRRTATASTDATFTELLPLDNPLMALAGPMVSVAGAFEFDAGRHWAVRELTVTGTSAVLNANATVSADATRLDGDYRLTVPELAVLSAIVQTPLAGKLTVAGEVGGSAADPTLTARITLPSLAVDDVVVGSGDARVSFTRLRSGVAGEVDVSVDDERIGAVALSSRFSGDPRDTLRFDGLVLESRDASLAGSMTIGLSDKTVTGQLVGQAIPLAPWSDLAGRALTGSARVALDMRGGKTQQLDLALTASEVTVALGPRRTLDVGAVDATARVEDVFGTPTGGLRAVATDAKIPDARFASVILEAKLHDRRRSSARLQARGELNTPFELEVIADYEAHDRGFVVTVSTLDASIAGQAVALTKPARIARHAGTTTLSKSTISIAGGHLVADGRLGVDVIEANLELERIALAALDAVAPLADVTGSLSGHARVSGARSAPAGVLDLRIADVRSAHTTLAVAPPASGRLSGDWRDGRLHLDATLAEVADTSIQARASMPLRLEPESLALSMPRDEAVDGELRWSGELGPVWDLLSPYEDRFTGPGDLALDLAGTVGSPQASGHFQVTGGRYENVQSGTTLIDVDLRLVGDGDKLVVEKLTGSDGKAGTLEGGGAIDFLPARDYPTNLHLRFSDMLLVARDDLILNASGSFALEGTFSNALLSGEIITGNSELSLAGTLPPEVVELDVQEVNITDAARARESSAQSTADPSIVILDLDVSVPGRAFVRGLGLDSEWRGEVKISGDARAPNVAGILQPVRGHFSLMGKRFTLEQGTIRFTGSDDVDPLLDLTAEHKTANLTAMVRVTGSASQPDVSLSSRPPLPESEIASQVLFGTDSSNLSAAQSLQLASAIATYSGRGGAVGILDSTRRALGVDVIGFAESEQDPDKTRVSVGKYVADGVYIEVEAGAEESSRTSTTVEVEVLPDVRIEGGTTEQGGNKVGVKWKWDY